MPHHIESIAICIPTFRRPQPLGQCLASIGQLQLPEQIKVIVIVVDNDVEQSGRDAFDAAAARLPVAAHYHVQPERGLAAVRNALLEHALAQQVSHIAFIDDDEQVHPAWLLKMIDALHRYQTDIITGPVIQMSAYSPAPNPPLPNASSNKVTHQSIGITLLNYLLICPNASSINITYQSGDTPRRIGTNNVLFSMRLVSELGLRFDPRFNFTGAEDMDFFERTRAQGATAAWLAEHLVFERAVPARETHRYLIYKSFAIGVGGARFYRRHYGIVRVFLYFTLLAMVRSIQAMRHLLLAIITSPARHANEAACQLARIAGLFCGLAGITTEPYRYD